MLKPARRGKVRRMFSTLKNESRCLHGEKHLWQPRRMRSRLLTRCFIVNSRSRDHLFPFHASIHAALESMNTTPAHNILSLHKLTTTLCPTIYRKKFYYCYTVYIYNRFFSFFFRFYSSFPAICCALLQARAAARVLDLRGKIAFCPYSIAAGFCAMISFACMNSFRFRK